MGGWLGVLKGADVLYLAFAEVTNGTFRKTVIPVGGPILKG
jgi:succinate-acetate transporter protein